MVSRLREEREKQKMTLEELAAKSGVSRQHIAALETEDGSVLVAKTKTLVKISDALGVPIEKLFWSDCQP